ncbi:MAG: hypothetical protein LBG11_01190, partial [Bifidobacteriaceae bacterium]|nr:hypothetical protein [Bifidobacteriaceae bacterium]
MARYRDKRGRVEWGTLFELDPSFREWRLGKLSDSEIARFLASAHDSSGEGVKTAADYFAACLLCYKANREEKRWDGQPAFAIKGLSAK